MKKYKCAECGNESQLSVECKVWGDIVEGMPGPDISNSPICWTFSSPAKCNNCGRSGSFSHITLEAKDED